jgi:hypothetical protein
MDMPSSPNTVVIPIFLAMRPFDMATSFGSASR